MNGREPGDHFKAYELACKGFELLESDNVNRYNWVATKVINTPSTLNIITTIENADIMVDNPSDWFILIVGPLERM